MDATVWMFIIGGLASGGVILAGFTIRWIGDIKKDMDSNLKELWKFVQEHVTKAGDRDRDIATVYATKSDVTSLRNEVTNGHTALSRQIDEATRYQNSRLDQIFTMLGGIKRHGDQ